LIWQFCAKWDSLKFFADTRMQKGIPAV
jgi:hypothetical protein